MDTRPSPGRWSGAAVEVLPPHPASSSTANPSAAVRIDIREAPYLGEVKIVVVRTLSCEPSLAQPGAELLPAGASDPLRFTDVRAAERATPGDPRVAGRRTGCVADDGVQRLQPARPAVRPAAGPGPGGRSPARLPRPGPGRPLAAH